MLALFRPPKRHQCCETSRSVDKGHGGEKDLDASAPVP